MLTFLILALFGSVTADSLPVDWSCKPLDSVKAGFSTCGSAEFDGSAWAVQPPLKSGEDFCTVGVDGTGVDYGNNFYIRGTINKAPGTTRGPFVGIAYNMQDQQNFNYIMLRFGQRVASLEIGFNLNGEKQMTAQEQDTTVGDANSAGVKVELLVTNGEENIYINGVHKTVVSAVEPHFYTPGPMGLWTYTKNVPASFLQKWNFAALGLEICHPHQCIADDDTVVQAGESYVDSDGKTCTCSLTGLTCVCGSSDGLVCGGATPTLWTDPETCISKCIPAVKVCSSTGDPHYHSFDGNYFDFHGQCTYQAASCGDFKVFFENYDLGAPAPRYTGQMKLEYKGEMFIIKNGNVAEVNGVTVALPYRKDYTDGSYVLITYSGGWGGLSLRLYSKGKDPAVEMIAQNAGSYINAYLYLHGSCADLTDGICGKWLNPEGHTFDNNDINTYVDHFKVFDDKCPAPPEPYHPCDDLEPTGYEESAKICEAVLKQAPFSACHGVLDPAQAIKNCQTDVCNAFLDEHNACATYDAYASSCINAGVNLEDWRNDVEYCPFNCPAGMAYSANGPDPAPTCLVKNPVQTGTHRGCFCPTGQYYQDGVCVPDDQCRCINEGIIYDAGAIFKNEGKCLECTCVDGGEMSCEDMVCPDLACDDDEIVSYKDDLCCPFCNDEWVVAVNPENKINEGQDLVLTCDILANNVAKKNIKWYKDGNLVKSTKKENISRNKKQLTIKDASTANQATYTCEAMLDGKVGRDDFNVEVVIPIRCTHEDGKVFAVGSVYNPSKFVACTCDAVGEYLCECLDDGTVCKDTEDEEVNEKCQKTCVHKAGTCSASADPHYSTFDGTTYNFQGKCIYKFFSGGGVEVIANHAADGTASAGTKSLDISFKTATIHLGAGNEVLLNGGNVGVPFRKDFTDGSSIVITNTGNYNLRIITSAADPLIELSWDKVNTYTLIAHGSLVGKTSGLCGKWDDEASNDMQDADGNVQESIEDFAQSFSLEDAEDCPIPPPPVDICDGLDDLRAEATKFCKFVLGEGAMGRCAAVIDQAAALDACIQDSCNSWEVQGACSNLNVYADKCTAAGVDADSWRLDSSTSICAPDCSDIPGTSFNAKGSKPAPTCGNVNPKGKKTQKGCFCPVGQVVEDGKCIDVSECRCQYAGIFYDSGDKYDKEGDCKTCQCKDGGVEKCTKIKCPNKCGKKEIAVQEDDECCPVCYADWVTAVNPKNDVIVNDDVALTCKIADGVIVAPEDIEWFSLDPAKAQKGQKKTGRSKDGLVLTLRSVNSFRTGGWKCVVTKDGKKAEAQFSVSTSMEEGDLIAVEEEEFSFNKGAKVVVLKVKIEKGAKITSMTWNCNGQELVNGDGKYTFKGQGAYKTLVIQNPTAEDVGSCTATAYGASEFDSETVSVKMNEVSVVLTPITPVQCKENVKGCLIKCTVQISDGSQVKKANGGFYKVGKDAKIAVGMVKAGNLQKDLGPRKTPKSAAGEYYCKYTHNGVEYTSDAPIVVDMDEQNTEVVLSATKATVDCQTGKSCIIRCNYEMTDGTKFSKTNGKFFKKNGDALGKAIASTWEKKGVMKADLGKKTTANVAGEYMCQYTHLGTKYVSPGFITVNWTPKVQKAKKKKTG